MVGMWLTTIGVILLLMIGVAFLVYTLKSALNTSDSYRVDKLPEQKK